MVKSSGSKVGTRLLGFAPRHWAAILIGVFGLLTLLSAVQKWRAGPLGALTFLPQLLLSLVLLAAVIAAKYMMGRVTTGSLAQKAAELQTETAKDKVRSVVDSGQAVVQRELGEAKETLASLAGDVKEDLGRLRGEGPRAGPLVTPTARRCASCNRFVRAGAKFCDGCGAALLADCPKCGRPLRAGAKFCDNCVAPIRPGS
jgi:hypothetical protein